MASLGFRLLTRIVPAFAPHLVRGLLSTCRQRIRAGAEIIETIVDRQKPFIGVVWHKDFLVALDFFRRSRKIVVMVSRSKDGEIVSNTLLRMGYRTVRGSSSAGGREALAELTDLVRNGWGSAIIADGPRGPARVSKMGPVLAARNSGIPCHMMGCHVTPNITLKNWDGTLIPKFGSTVNLAFGGPVEVPAHADREELEQARAAVDAKMAELEAICRAAGPS